MDDSDYVSETLAGLMKKIRNEPLPSGYFQDVETKVMSRIQLEKFKGEPSDEVPLDYFDNLPDRVMERVGQSSRAGQVLLMSRLRWFAIAASFVLVIFAVGKWNPSKNDVPKLARNFEALNDGFANDLTSEDMEYLIGQFNSEEDLHLLKSMEQLDHNALPEIKASTSEEELFQDILTDEDIEYLNEIM
ncbi:MAG: hypothetical protein IPN29_19240 [Saprospiraceae bacterium]|nr:hypothetical protein [Saprospiraceae bacterium]